MEQKQKSRMMITALAWVKRGFAKPVTEEADLKDPREEEKEGIRNTEQVMEPIEEGPDGEDEFNMKNYDKEDNLPVFGEDFAEDGEGEDDIEMDEDKFPFAVKDEEEEEDDNVVLKSDALIVTAAAEQDYSNLEVYIYEEQSNNLFMHHEIMLNAYPLCLEWIPYVPGSNASFQNKGNYIAVGTFSPAIEIWNLDIVDAVEPVITLGGETKVASNVPLASMKKKNKEKYFEEGSHLDSVLCLAAHPTQVNYLASGSADKIVKIWDLSTQKCVRNIKNHKDKVQVLKWQPGDEKNILSAGFDGKGVV
jgi:periodic tryptophan protein 1